MMGTDVVRSYIFYLVNLSNLYEHFNRNLFQSMDRKIKLMDKDLSTPICIWRTRTLLKWMLFSFPDLSTTPPNSCSSFFFEISSELTTETDLHWASTCKWPHCNTRRWWQDSKCKLLRCFYIYVYIFNPYIIKIVKISDVFTWTQKQNQFVVLNKVT